jgi:hypothetical protein
MEIVQKGFSLARFGEQEIIDYAIQVQAYYGQHINCHVEFVGNIRSIHPWADSRNVKEHNNAEFHDMVISMARHTGGPRQFLIYLQAITQADLDFFPHTEPMPKTNLQHLQTILYKRQSHVIFTAKDQSIVDEILGKPRSTVRSWSRK